MSYSTRAQKHLKQATGAAEEHQTVAPVVVCWLVAAIMWALLDIANAIREWSK